METAHEFDYVFLSEYVDNIKKTYNTKFVQPIIEEDETEKKPVD